MIGGPDLVGVMLSWIGTPSIWVEQTPLTLGDGQARTLYHPEIGAIPADAAFLARDVLGRWWPRRRRLHLRIRRRRMRRRSQIQGE